MLKDSIEKQTKSFFLKPNSKLKKNIKGLIWKKIVRKKIKTDIESWN